MPLSRSDCMLQYSMMLPLVFEPHFKSVVWGGRRLERFGKALPAGPIGESWEMSVHPHHVSRVAEGVWSGRLLTDLFREHGDALGRDRFPWLIKYLDCDGLLSIQVHPDDEQAQRLLGEPNGKSEVWLVLDAEEEGRIFAGFKPGVAREEVVCRLRDGTLENCMHAVAPKPGDCFYLPAGTVHAVGRGVVIAEIQQSSDATFRLFDWNRVGLDGKPRPLHVEASLACINWDAGPVLPRREVVFPDETWRSKLLECPFFQVERLRLHTTRPSPHVGRMSVGMVAEGTAELRIPKQGYTRRLPQGTTVLIPASCPPALWEPVGTATVLAVT